MTLRNGILGVAMILSACSATDVAPHDAFFDTLSGLCGKAFEGKVISKDEVDADWRKEVLTIHVNNCSEDVINIPLHVGENRSRTWVISKTETGLRLKHDHRHEDGEPDAVTMYGGDTEGTGTALRQSFPVDPHSIELFTREGLTASVTNVWSLSIDPGQTLTYELTRPGRLFQAEIDLTKEVEAPPPAWGHAE